MVSMDKYNESFMHGFHKNSDVHHIRLSNCHLFDGWIEVAIDIMIILNKEILWIGVDE